MPGVGAATGRATTLTYEKVGAEVSTGADNIAAAAGQVDTSSFEVFEESGPLKKLAGAYERESDYSTMTVEESVSTAPSMQSAATGRSTIAVRTFEFEERSVE